MLRGRVQIKGVSQILIEPSIFNESYLANLQIDQGPHLI